MRLVTEEELMQERELQRGSGLKLAEDEETISQLQQDVPDNPWDFGVERDPFVITQSTGYASETVTERPIPSIVKKSGMVAHLGCLMQIFMLLPLAIQPDPELLDNVTFMGIVGSFVTISYYIDAIIINTKYYKKRSLYFWIWFVGAWYLPIRDKHVHDVAFVGVVLATLLTVLLIMIIL